jgi:acyl transferase domain-containing protein
MDPQQRLLLEVFAEALYKSASSSAMRASSASASGRPPLGDVGVYVGISSMDYQKLAAHYTAGVTAYSATGVSLSVAAGRLSYSFGLRGPALAVDTACSSSLVAAHTAGLTLKAGIIHSAAAAGSNLTLSPDTPAMFTRAGMLSPEGRCKTLDAAADGYVRAEAVGVMVLEMLGNINGGLNTSHRQVLAMLSGSAVNQDGRSSSLTAPNGPAQQSVMRTAMSDGQLKPDSIAGLSLHGTGTPLGEEHRAVAS